MAVWVFVVANVLFAVGSLPLAVMALGRVRWGPEGPVGAHMVTGPLALAVAVGLGLGVAACRWATAGLAQGWLYACLPGLVVGLTIAPIAVGSSRGAPLARIGTIAPLLGGVAVLHGDRVVGASSWLAVVGLALVAAPALYGYGLLVGLWLASERRRMAAATEAIERQSAFEQKQAALQREEWARLSEDAALWQLIPFAHAHAPEVRDACRARIAALPDLTGAMRALLGTGWASHALRYLAQDMPGSTAPLDAALSAHLHQEALRWRRELDPRANPGSWFGNLLGPIEAAERVARDGGDVRAAMQTWHELLRGMPGLESLAARAGSLSTSATVGR